MNALAGLTPLTMNPPSVRIGWAAGMVSALSKKLAIGSVSGSPS
jgi:hypothetical protein